MANPEHAPHRSGFHVLGSTGPTRMRSLIVHQRYQAILGPPSNTCDDLMGAIWLQEYGGCDDRLPGTGALYVESPQGWGGSVDDRQ